MCQISAEFVLSDFLTPTQDTAFKRLNIPQEYHSVICGENYENLIAIANETNTSIKGVGGGPAQNFYFLSFKHML